MATISKGITLGYGEVSGSSYTELTNLQEIPELGGDVDAIEVTTLGDAAHVYTDGIKSYGDSLTFKFLYDKTQFTMLNQMSKVEREDGAGLQPHGWKVTLPDGAACTFAGTCSVKLDGVGVNAALTYTLSIKPSTGMSWVA